MNPEIRVEVEYAAPRHWIDIIAEYRFPDDHEKTHVRGQVNLELWVDGLWSDVGLLVMVPTTGDYEHIHGMRIVDCLQGDEPGIYRAKMVLKYDEHGQTHRLVTYSNIVEVTA